MQPIFEANIDGRLEVLRDSLHEAIQVAFLHIVLIRHHISIIDLKIVPKEVIEIGLNDTTCHDSRVTFIEYFSPSVESACVKFANVLNEMDVRLTAQL